MATVTKRKNSYYISVSCGYDMHGKQVRQTMTWKPSPGMTEKQIKKELDRQKTLFEESVRSGQLIYKDIKFEAFAKQWLQQIELENRLKPTTIEKYKRLQARTYTAIGHLKLCAITTMHIQKFINNLAEDGINKDGSGLSTKTQSLYLNFISDVFNYAIKCNLLVNNPCRNVSTIKKPTKAANCYTLEEAQQFLEALEAAPIKYKVFFTLAIYTGMRRGELLGLEWKDINFTADTLTVNRISVYLPEKGIFTSTPKTKESQRSLKVPHEIINLLLTYRAAQNEERLRIGDKWINTDRLFTVWNGATMYPTTPAEWLKKFCKRSGLKYVNVHSFRHLNASLLITSGTDIKTVSAALGHSQTSTTLNIYAHTFAETQAQASEAIAAQLNLGRSEQKNHA